MTEEADLVLDVVATMDPFVPEPGVPLRDLMTVLTYEDGHALSMMDAMTAIVSLRLSDELELVGDDRVTLP